MSGDSTLDRLIRIMSAFDARSQRLTVVELAEKAQLPLPTTYRWVNNLVEHRLLQHHADGQVGPGIRFWELASRASPSNTLRNAALPVMHDIQAVLRQHSQLAVLDDDGALILERLSAPNAVENQAIVASRMPIFTTSLGLILLAYSEKNVLDGVLERSGHLLGQEVRQTTEGSVATVRNPTLSELRVQLAIVHREGFATVPGHIDVETAGVAVPIHLESDGEVGHRVAALGVVVPREGWSARSMVPLLQVSARTISRALMSSTEV